MDKQTKILVICPSRGRPKQCKQMIDSFLENSSLSTMKLCLDMDDPNLDEYRDTVCKLVSYTIDFQKPTTQIINEHWEFSADCFKYFSVTNDDFIYHTKEWDKKLLYAMIPNKGIGIAYGNDLLQGINMPTTSVVSREIVEALGWLQMPLLTHLFGDNVWHIIGKEARCIHYNSNVIIEHKHPFTGRIDKDETFHRTNSKSMYQKDEQAFIQWLKDHKDNDVKKVKDVLSAVNIYT